ncbi:amidase signature enzyme [Suhomyces tanzawaensis NRRL Y-17324]|uniref:Glutamyl-tRNA(Gln) amidotransferase subunit A, mitochondrial n=1 Tax=Suhomyces tanzawaensis NRRL Y-17324 TaxID=984487 RepID=A0A1E4SGX3_9ASCO|nr:amidase signature enzyme [Suhomyces tanzawaensis NRRL Y-17324]ODV78720.1 amidase signature enzyme [Suhomyces tanzawaensis NRRL Y-17324]
MAHDAWNSLVSRRVADATPPESPETTTGSQLQGTTFAVKDNIATTAEATTGGSRTLESYTSPFAATVVQLLEQEGLAMVGKANLDEFGMGSSTTNSWFGTTTNARYENDVRVAGGSSGGSASAVAANLATFSLGTDTGGSVRLPASYCGVVGFKPSYGRVSRWGVIPYAQTLDTVGILARDIDTVLRVFGVLDRHDPKDPTSITTEVRGKIAKTTPSTSYTFGVPSQLIVQELSPEVIDQWTSVLEKLQEQGHKIRQVSLPSIKQLLPAYYTLATAEAASNLSRYDGVRYGHSAESAPSPTELITGNRHDAFGPEVQRRILLGNYTLSSSSGDHYLRATKIREQLVHEFNEIFNVPSVLFADAKPVQTDNCDFLISPTAFGPPPTVEEYLKKNEENFLNTYINDLMTVPASLAGIPAVSIPLNETGIQIMGQFGDDESVLAVAKDLMEMFE